MYPLPPCSREQPLGDTSVGPSLQKIGPNLGNTFKTLRVRADGNCFWRALAKALWGSDLYWLRVKVAVLGWALVHVDTLTGADGSLFINGRYPQRLFGLHHDVAAQVLLGTVSKLCMVKAWGGGLAAVLVAEALGVTVKMVDVTDREARGKEDKSKKKKERGTGRKGDVFKDSRTSQKIISSCPA